MVAEAVATGRVAGANPARQLAERPDTVRSLTAHRGRLRELETMGLRFVEVTRADVLDTAPALQARYGLLTNDSIVLACAARLGADFLVTCDAALGEVQELPVLLLADVSPPPPRSRPPAQSRPSAASKYS